MTITPKNVIGHRKQAKPLNKVLAKSQRVKGMIDECGEKMSFINAELMPDKSRPDLHNIVQKTHKVSAAVESRVNEAATELSLVNRSLSKEVRERHLLEHQLAMAKAQEKRTHHAAFYDALTDLPNRALFDDRLRHGVAHAKRHDSTLAIMFLDLDNFKSINDAYGHDAGDSILKTISQRLKKTTRSDDTVSRHGGDEFSYLLMDFKNEEDITVIAEKILKSIKLPCIVGKQNLTIEASIGISLFPKDGSTSEGLLKSADEAMYHAKRTRSGYAFA